MLSISFGSFICENAVKNGSILAWIFARCGNAVRSIGASSSKNWNIPSPVLFNILLISSEIEPNGSVDIDVINGCSPT